MQLKQKKPNKYRKGMRGAVGRPRNTFSKKWYDWLNAVVDILQKYPTLKLTVRQIFYQLVANYKMPKTEGYSNGVSKHLVEARKDDKIDWERIVDFSRKPIQKEYIGKEISPEDWFKAFFKIFKKNCGEYQVPAYENQDKLIEVWVEHEGLIPFFVEALEGIPVTIYSTKGRNSWSAFYQAYERLKDVQRDIAILFFSDCDKYGNEMRNDIEYGLKWFGYRYNLDKLKNIKVLKVALTEQQIKDKTFGDLPQSPIKKEGTQLEAIPPDIFKNLIRSTALDYIDQTKLAETSKRMKEGQKKIWDIFNDKIDYDDEEE